MFTLWFYSVNGTKPDNFVTYFLVFGHVSDAGSVTFNLNCEIELDQTFEEFLTVFIGWLLVCII